MSPARSASRLAPTAIRIPDLMSHCTFELHIDRNHKLVAAESKKWLFNGDPDLDEAAFHGLKAGKLISMCYYNAGYPQLRVCTDFSNYLFYLDNLSDDMDDRSIDSVANVVMNTIHHPDTYHSSARLNRMTKEFVPYIFTTAHPNPSALGSSFYKRITQTASSGTCRRFRETMKLYFQAIQQQALDRANGIIPDLESYITLRRDTSGCKPSWVLIEYAYHLNIPDEVMSHPIISGLGEATNDFVAWSNDIISYDVEQSKDQTHNMVDVIMHERGLDLQDAIDLVGDYCTRAFDRFVHDRANLPSWGPAIDADVRVYVDGLTHWMAGSLHWSFETERYFGKVGKQIKATRLVNLRP